MVAFLVLLPTFLLNLSIILYVSSHFPIMTSQNNLSNNTDPSKRKALRCIIVDDEPNARRGMAQLISLTPSLSLQASLASAEEAKEWLTRNSTDLIFLDIEMPGLSGLDFAATLQGQTRVIFTTAYSEYAAQSYDVEAVDYLLKPVTSARFAKAVNRALSVVSPPEYIMVRTDRQNLRLNTSHIIYIEGMKDYVRIHCPDRRIISRITIKTLLDLLPADDFIRIHKSYIVNKRYVTAFDFSSVEVADQGISGINGFPNVTLPLGGSYREEFEKKWTY